MFIRILYAAAVAAVVLLIWGYVFWAVLAVPDKAIRVLPADDALGAAIAKAAAQSGSYLWCGDVKDNGPPAAGAGNVLIRQYQGGPLAHLFYCSGEHGVGPISTAARGLLQLFVAALLAAWLLSTAMPALNSYASRAGFVLVAGMFGTVLVNLGQPIWFHHPWYYHLVMAVFDCSSALVMGLVLAAVLRPAPGSVWSLDGQS
jgi:hypothetical protein